MNDTADWFQDEKVIACVSAILIEECGASHHVDSIELLAHWLRTGAIAREYRFGGALGGGGKLWVVGGRISVGCYKEDDTPLRSARIERANVRLAELEHVATDQTAFQRYYYELIHEGRRFWNPVEPGSKFVIPYCAHIFGTFKGNEKLAARRQTITVHDVDNGWINHSASRYRGQMEFRAPSVTWVGSGGYWHHAFLTDDVLLANGLGLPHVTSCHAPRPTY